MISRLSFGNLGGADADFTSPVFKWFMSICMPSAQRLSASSCDIIFVRELECRTFAQRPLWHHHVEGLLLKHKEEMGIRMKV